MRKKLIILLAALVTLLSGIDTESYEAVQITTEPSAETSLAVKNSNEIYFASDRYGNFDVFKKNLKTEKVTRITSQPSNEYPAFYGKRLLMISDETDIHGNIYELEDNGSQKLIYHSVGAEKSPFLNGSDLYFTSGGKLGMVKRSGKKPSFTGSDIGEKALLSGSDLIYSASGDIYGFSNIYVSRLENGKLSESVQATFGTKIITGLSAPPDGSYIVYSAITGDTNGDLLLDIKDNSVLYRIDKDGEYYSDPMQLTPESYSSKDPEVTPEGRIYFISDRMGSSDIWSCGNEGIIPDLKDFTAQAELSERLFDEYTAKSALSTITGSSGSQYTELLSSALLSYNRTISFQTGSDQERSEVYFRIAEIYEIQKKYAQAESIYRIIISRYAGDEIISSQAEIKRISVELKRRNIPENVYGYEIDEYIRYLNSLAEKYKSKDALNSIYLKIGRIYFFLGRYTTAGSYFLRCRTNADGTDDPESLFSHSLSTLGEGNAAASESMLDISVRQAESPEDRERYISSYFELSEQTGTIRNRIYNIITNESISDEIRSYAGLKDGDMKANFGDRASAYREVKKYYVKKPDNVTLKRFSARADLKLSEILAENGYEDESEGLLKYMTDSYRGIDYDLYSIAAGIKLSEIYLERAEKFTSRKLYDNALLTYTSAYELDSRNAKIIRGIADSYSNLNKTDEAVRFFSNLYSRNTSDPYLNYAMGYSYSLKGAVKRDLTEAVDYLNRALELDSGLKYAYLTLSFCHEALHLIVLREESEDDDRNFFLKTLDYITGPFKFILETVNIIEDTDTDHTETAISLLGKGLILCQKESDRELEMKMKLNLANNYYNMGEYARKQALFYYLEVINGGYEFSSSLQKAMIYERTGHCMFTADDEAAVEYYDKALEIYKNINDRKGELRVSMRTALLYLTKEDKEGDMIGGDEAFSRYSEIILKLKSEDNPEAVSLIKRNSAFAKLVDQEYAASAGIIDEIFDNEPDFTDERTKNNMIVLNFLGLDIPVWKLDLVIGSQYSEGFEGTDELALLYAMQASNYHFIKDFNKVSEYLKNKAEVFRKKGNRLALSLIENRLGIVEYYRKNWKESVKRFENSKEACLELELYGAALENENNILKAMLSGSRIMKLSDLHAAAADTMVLSVSKTASDVFSRAENLNLKGAINYSLFKTLVTGQPAEKYQAFKYLDRSIRDLTAADSVISAVKRSSEQKNSISAAILFNLSAALSESGDLERSIKVFENGKAFSDLTRDKLLKWRYLLRAGDVAQEPGQKLEYWTESEKILSEYLPSTADYELITGWREDIRPLYDRLISWYLKNNDPFTAMNYAERYKSRILLNYYSSRYIDYKEQLHQIHIKKIRFNNEEIIRYRQNAEIMRNKDPEKYANTIEEYEKQADFYEKELDEIFSQIKRSNDERLLQFVSIEDIDEVALDEITGEYKAVLSVYSMPDRDLYFLRSAEYTKFAETAPGEPEKIYEVFSNELEETEHLFIIPDPDSGSFAGHSMNSEYIPDHLIVTLIPTVRSLKTVTENANINYSEFKKASEININSEDMAPAFENGGIIYFDGPAGSGAVNALEKTLSFGGNTFRVKDVLKYKIPAYAVLTGDNGKDCMENIIMANSMIFAGVQTVIMCPNSTAVLAEKLRTETAEKSIAAIIKESRIGCTVFGLSGMNKEEQREFASSNLRSSLMDAVRYYNSRVYEKAAVHFIQALAMARNVGDKQELNILKTLISSLSKIKDYKRAVSYGLELIKYAEKNSLDKEKILAYDSVSKDHFRNKDYDKSIEFQNMIISDPSAEDEHKNAAYDMLSVIYSYKGDHNRSIEYKRKYLEKTGLLSSGKLDILPEEAGVKESELLFNSLRNIMVSYYRANETDSALSVYNSINSNLELFEDVSAESFGELLVSAGLCYMKISEYSKAEELFFESLDYFDSEARKVPVYISIADVCYYTDRLSSALEHLDLAEKSVADDGEKMRIFNTRSLVEVKLNNIPAARTYSYKALEKTIENSDEFTESTARVNLAKIMILENDVTGAQKNLSKSIELAHRTGNVQAMISAEFYRGDIYLDLKNMPDSALISYSNCIGLSKNAGDGYFTARGLYGKGLSLLALNRTDSGIVYIENSMDIAERSGFSDVFLKSALSLAGLHEKRSPDTALSILDKLTDKADSLVSRSANQLPSDQIPVILKGYEKKIYLLLKDSKIDEAVSEMSGRDRLIRSNDLKYFSLSPKISSKDESTSGIKEIQASLDNETALLLLQPHGKEGITVVITRNKVVSFGLSITKEFGDLTANIESKGEFLSASKKVYERIFVKEATDNLSGITNLIIYSTGSLKNYPFDALYDGKMFLCDRFSLTETDRLSSAIEFPEADRTTRALSLFDPFTAESDLVYAKREAGSLSDFLNNTKLVTGTDATESLLRSAAAAKYGMIHLPVHSFVLKKDSLAASGRSSYIQLSADDSNDGKTDWKEISQTDMNGKTVILSGCDTGGRSGEEYYSHFDLTAAFFEAGAKSVISSKWRTDDLAASVLMKRYFRNVAAGLSVPEALTQAKRDVRTYFDPHPYYWANFKLAVR